MSGQIEKLLADLIAETRAAHPHRPALIGVGGAQGSGKTTICTRFAETHPRVAHFSLDDVYSTRAERERLAQRLHPNFITRGPPGTHDLSLAYDVFNSLKKADSDNITPLPRFDKALDDRAPISVWPMVKGRPEAILLDGWCMGARHVNASSYEPPLNRFEEEDADGAWRRFVEGALATDYAGFFATFDEIIYLQAPNFEIVRRWRGQQEEAMLGRPMTEDEAAALDRFIMHYERVTRSMLDGGLRATWIVRLDENRNILAIEGPR